MSKLTPCRHLDHEEGKYGPDIDIREGRTVAILTLETMAPHYPEVKFWLRGPVWTDAPSGCPPGPSRVQFCGQGRGRINGVFQCYTPGEMSCYEPARAESHE